MRRRLKTVFVVCTIFLFSIVFVPISNANWPMYRSDVSRSGVGTGDLERSPSILWESNITKEFEPTTVNFEERIFTAAAVVDGVVYICSNSRVATNNYHTYLSWADAYAFNATNGAEMWNYRINSSSQISSPAVVNGIVYFGADINAVYALSASSGALFWESAIPNIGLSSPAVSDGLVYVGGDNGNVYALNAVNGDIVWNNTAGVNVGWSSPAVDNGVVYIGSNDNNFYALSARNGSQLWKFNANGWVMSSPAVANRIVYASSSDGNLYALNAATGVRIWNFSTLAGRGSSPPAVANGLVFIDAYDGYNYALNATTGVKVWNFTAPTGTGSPPVVASGIVISVRPFGIYALSAESGTVIWKYFNSSNQPFGSEPAVDNGILYFGSGEQVYALGNPRPSSPSPSVPELPLWIVLPLVVTTGLLIAIVTKKKRNRNAACA